MNALLLALLLLQQVGDPGAYVSSGFHDWRGVSQYRSVPGIHAGYDIAMLAGSPVRAAWPGTVVAVTPWYGSEYGVTVQSAGFSVTYGHISPGVAVGDPVEVGTVLGTVVVDHVDVKMRAASGDYVDFGAGSVAVAPPLPVESREARRERLIAERDRLAREVRLAVQLEMAEARAAKTSLYLAHGLVAPKEAAAAQASVDRLRKALKALGGDVAGREARLARLEAEVGPATSARPAASSPSEARREALRRLLDLGAVPPSRVAEVEAELRAR